MHLLEEEEDSAWRSVPEKREEGEVKGTMCLEKGKMP